MAKWREDQKIRKGPWTLEEDSCLTYYIALHGKSRWDFVTKASEREVEKTRKGPWTLEEDSLLTSYIALHGKGRWDLLAKAAGLNRSGSSCRLRWVNYLCPDLKCTAFTPEEERLIIELHTRWGNRWSRIAQCLPGRTDNAVKNFFRTRIKKKNHLLEGCNSIRHVRHENLQSIIRSSSIPTSFRKQVCVQDNDEKYFSTSLPRQSIEDGQVMHRNAIKEENPDTWNGGQSESVSMECVDGHSTEFPYNCFVESLNAMTLPELYGEGKVGCFLYNTASPIAFANTELYSDELWNVDEG